MWDTLPETEKIRRAKELRQTVISCIGHKLERMNIDQLREVMHFASEVIERGK